MNYRYFILQAGNFKQERAGREDKWRDSRGAVLILPNGENISFKENEGEIAIRLKDGDEVKYQKLFRGQIDTEETLLITDVTLRFHKFK